MVNQYAKHFTLTVCTKFIQKQHHIIAAYISLSNRDWIFIFCSPFNLLNRETLTERREKKEKRVDEVPDPTDQKLLKLKCIHCALFTMYIYYSNWTPLPIIYSLFVESTDLKYVYFFFKVCSTLFHILQVRDIFGITI